MSVDVAAAVANVLERRMLFAYLLWHGGEPLSIGPRRFRDLVGPFASLRQVGLVKHSLQTNATLVNDEWCEFFKEESFRVGVSLDGPEHLDNARLNWSGKPSYAAARRGIDALHRNNVRFGVIAVVNCRTIDYPEELYDFFLTLPTRGLNFNIEESEGLNRNARPLEFEKVKAFWSRLFHAWRANPELPIREFENVLGWMLGVARTESGSILRRGDLWPTVAFNGDVVVLSPEFIGAPIPERSKFIIGNVLDTPLDEILARSVDAAYVRQYHDGRAKCEAACPYFSYCGGGQPSNKYFELGTLDGTETTHCRNTRQALVEAVLESLEEPNAIAPFGGCHAS